MSCKDCNHDNYRCFHRVGTRGNDGFAFVQFWDGSVYMVAPVSLAEFKAELFGAESPGCFFNCTLRKRSTYVATKLKVWPSDLLIERVWTINLPVPPPNY